MTTDELEERFTALAVRVIALVRELPKDVADREVGRQLLRSANSAAANHRAARRGRSRREFRAKISIVLEEIDETEHWIEIVQRASLLPPARCAPIRGEANELMRIIAATRRSLDAEVNDAPMTQPR